MKNFIKTITKKDIEKISQKYYGGGKEIKIGDKLIFGFIVPYASLRGIPPTKIRKIEMPPSLAMLSFVLPKGEKFIYQLYSIEK